MFYANIILSIGSGTTENMSNMVIVEAQNPKQSIGRLQRYQKEISGLDVSRQEDKRTAVEISEDYFECLKTRIVASALWVNAQAKDGDIERNRVNYGETIAWAQIMQDIAFVRFQQKREKARRSLYQMIHVCALKREFKKKIKNDKTVYLKDRILYLPLYIYY